MADITWSFAGKVALLSGGASGIGRAAAAAWIAAGARVVAFDQSGERLAEMVSRFGQVDILLNAAGTGAMGRVWELEPAIWDRVLAVNLRGTFLLTRAASRWLVEQKRPGRIIN